MEVDIDSGFIVHFAQRTALCELRLALGVRRFLGCQLRGSACSAPSSTTADARKRPDRSVHQLDFAKSVFKDRFESFLGGIDLAAPVAVGDDPDAHAVKDGVRLGLRRTFGAQATWLDEGTGGERRGTPEEFTTGR